MKLLTILHLKRDQEVESRLLSLTPLRRQSLASSWVQPNKNIKFVSNLAPVVVVILF